MLESLALLLGLLSMARLSVLLDSLALLPGFLSALLERLSALESLGLRLLDALLPA